MRTLMKTALTACVVLVAGIAGTGTASANSPTSATVTQFTSGTGGDCMAVVQLDSNDINTANNAQGQFYQSNSGFTCSFWLQRGTWDGSAWNYTPIGSWSIDKTVLPNAPYLEHTTGWYADGSGYRVEACFVMSDNTGWVGIPHCTAGI